MDDSTRTDASPPRAAALLLGLAPAAALVAVGLATALVPAGPAFALARTEPQVWASLLAALVIAVATRHIGVALATAASGAVAFGLSLVVIGLRPQTVDGGLYLGGAWLQASFSSAVGFVPDGFRGTAVDAVEAFLPWLLFAAWYVRADAERRGRVATLLVATPIAAQLANALAPAIGPLAFFGSLYPDQLPATELVDQAALAAAPAMRLAAAPVATVMAGVVALGGPGTRFGRLGLGLLGVCWLLGMASGAAWLLSLVASVAVAALVVGLASRGTGVGRLAAGVAAFFVFAMAPPWLPRGLLVSPVFALAGVAVAVALLVVPQPADRGEASDDGAVVHDPWVAICAGVFFLSGFAGLVYQVVFAKSLALTFGSTATASTTVLATYMAGIALGSWLGGKWAARIRSGVVGYALAELTLAAWCAFAPQILAFVRTAYVVAASGADPSAPWVIALQLALGASALLAPTIMMGLTFPFLTQFLTTRDETLGRAVAVLYGFNTAGAAVGALSTGYFLIPAVGITWTLRIAVLLNVTAAGLALLLSRGLREGNAAEAAAGVAEVDAPRPTRAAIAGGWIAAAVLGVGGFVTFSLEVASIHLLAVVAGNSAFAFSLMLFAFLIGLGAGSGVGRRALTRGVDPMWAMGLAQLALATTVVAGTFVWDGLPAYFAGFDGYPSTRGFAARELVRFVVCSVAMIPPAVCIGASYPLAMELVGRADPARRILRLGQAAAFNTLGNILGALLTGFVILRALGALGTLHMVAGLSATLGLITVFGLIGRQRSVVLAVFGALAVTLVIKPHSFDMQALTSGANVYFEHQSWGPVVDHAESLDGGLTSVHHSATDENGRLRYTMLTNGKFQGDNRAGGQMVAQVSFGLIPLLHTPARDHALAIGLGTGVTARALADAGFAEVDVVELSGDIVDMARRYFSDVNAAVLERPNVHTWVTDGRNFLLLQEQKYDVISLEISSIWFAGAASLYNREFYELVSRRLTERGVLQQWIQLHHISQDDLFRVMTTARAVFPNTWLYVSGGQGILVACHNDCRPTEENLRVLAAAPALADVIEHIGGSPAALLGRRVLDPTTMARFILDSSRRTGISLEDAVSTDDNLILEYSTPRGNVMGEEGGVDANLEALSVYRPPTPLDGTAIHPPPREAAPDGPAPPAPPVPSPPSSGAADGLSAPVDDAGR